MWREDQQQLLTNQEISSNITVMAGFMPGKRPQFRERKFSDSDWSEIISVQSSPLTD